MIFSNKTIEYLRKIVNLEKLDLEISQQLAILIELAEKKMRKRGAK